MNTLFLKTTGFFAVSFFLATSVAAAVVVNLAFLVCRWRRQAGPRYLVFIKRWLFRRALPALLLLTSFLLLLAVIPASLLAWYRTQTIHQLAESRLVLRVYDQVESPEEGGVTVYQVSHSTTNSAEIAELLAAIRFSPTYPNYGCFCVGGRKFELSRLNRRGIALGPVETFTIPHDQSIRLESDWYGDWHLSRGSQQALVVWQRKHVTPITSTVRDEIGTRNAADSR